MKIAVVGSGISGLSAAWALRDQHDVTVFEARERLGGHAHTMTIDYLGHEMNVDVGFIVYNALNYPNLIAFFEALGVKTKESDMSFAVSDPNGYEWASNVRGIFAQKRNFFSPKFHKFWRTILKFNDIARKDLEDGTLKDSTLGAWLQRHGFDDDFCKNYIQPMAAAIWSTPEAKVLDYPALSFFRFFDNHRLMHKERPMWRTVDNGSQSYVTKVAEALGERVRLDTPVVGVMPFGDKVKLRTRGQADEVFDQVILATHSDQALEVLSDSYQSQKFALGSVRYRPNQIYLHRDPTLMPKRKAAWAAWNVLKSPNREEICLTYWMNLLQGLPKERPLFVTLNPEERPNPDLTFAEFAFDHPQFDLAAEAAVRTLKAENGKQGIWFAGAWMGSGFHEDGLKAGLEAALSLGGVVPWEAANISPRDFVPGPTDAPQKIERAV